MKILELWTRNDWFVYGKLLSMKENEITGLEFPCDFPLRVIGEGPQDFKAFVMEIIYRHIPDIDNNEVNSRLSSGGKYLAVSMNFIAQSREQMDALYIELSDQKRIKYIL
ncbi:MAG: DUF493 domain-containing protein [Anaerolineaceae bacterium]|nr:DUF493 domain-containing protein [Anaerolineaceae bacterium]